MLVQVSYTVAVGIGKFKHEMYAHVPLIFRSMLLLRKKDFLPNMFVNVTQHRKEIGKEKGTASLEFDS